jgi:Methyltransferase domain
MDALRPRKLVELGTYSGYSFAAFCQAVQATGIECACYGVDHWHGDDHSGFFGEDVYRAIKEHTDTHYGSFARLIRSDFNQALAHFADGSIDLLHIDGCHSYEAVREDFLNWRPRLSKSAVVLFHDTNVYERGFGVARLWDELCREHRHFSFLHGHGLGVLGIGDEFPKPLAALFDASNSPEATTQIRLAYSKLGVAVGDRHFQGNREAFERQRTEEKTKLSQMELELGRLSSRQAYLTAMIAQRDADISLQTTELSRLRAESTLTGKVIGLLRRSPIWPLTAPLRSVVRQWRARG